jgi:hypothetical protein
MPNSTLPQNGTEREPVSPEYGLSRVFDLLAWAFLALMLARLGVFLS